jgi:F-type H+-transporting ATPase subunit delta
MAETKVSIRYANSLLDLTTEKNNLNEISNDMELILSAIRSSSDLRNLLKSPVVKYEVKQSILNEIFVGKVGSDTLNFIHFVVEKGREHILSSIVEKFLELRDAEFGIVRAEVKTSYDFSDEQKENLRRRLENILNKKAHLSFIVDKTILGGFIAKVGDTVYDASIKHQLELLRKEFLKGNIPLN